MQFPRKFMATGSVAGTQRTGRSSSGRSEENIQNVEEAYALSQGKYIRSTAVKLDIIRSSIQRMLRKDIKTFPTSCKMYINSKKEVMTVG